MSFATRLGEECSHLPFRLSMCGVAVEHLAIFAGAPANAGVTRGETLAARLEAQPREKRPLLLRPMSPVITSATIIPPSTETRKTAAPGENIPAAAKAAKGM